MGCTINFYLDSAVSESNVNKILSSKDQEAKKELRQRITEKPLQIFIYLRYSGKTVKVYTERKCTQKQWDAGKQRVDSRYYKSGAIDLNRYLGNIDEAVGKKYEENNNRGIVTNSEHIKNIIAELNNRSGIAKYVTFENAYQEFMEAKKQKFSLNTVKKYKTTIKHLQEFARHSKTKLLFENINSKFEVRFRDYLLGELNMTNNTVAKYIKALKTFMNFCTFDRGYNSKLNLDYKKFDSKESPTEVYALSLDELMKLYHYEFKNVAYAHVRDVFCFLCFTGLRFSDAEKLKREDIKSNRIHLLIKKTRRPMIIPLNSFAKQILDKYKGEERPLPIISNQKTNDHLHDIGKLLEFNEPVKKISYKGAEVEEKYVPKHEILTTHIGRKTFITTSLILGMQERQVKEFSGHKNESNFRRYVAFADSYKQQVMNDIWSEEQIAKMQQS